MPRYCQHHRCQVSSMADLARIALVLRNANLLQYATEAATYSERLTVRCRMYPGQLTADGFPPLEDFEFPSTALEKCT